MAMKIKLNFRCDDAFEKMMLRKMSEAGFSSYSELIRESIHNVTIKQRCSGIQELIKEVNKIGVNLNQFSKHTNEKKMIDQLAIQGINDTYKQLTTIIQRFTK